MKSNEFLNQFWIAWLKRNNLHENKEIIQIQEKLKINNDTGIWKLKDHLYLKRREFQNGNTPTDLCGLRLILIEYGFTENAIEKSREDNFQMPKRWLCSFYQYKAKKKFWELVTLLGISSHKYAVVLYLLNFCWAVLLHWIWKHCSAIPNQIVFFDMQLVV